MDVELTEKIDSFKSGNCYKTLSHRSITVAVETKTATDFSDRSQIQNCVVEVVIPIVFRFSIPQVVELHASCNRSVTHETDLFIHLIPNVDRMCMLYRVSLYTCTAVMRMT